MQTVPARRAREEREEKRLLWQRCASRVVAAWQHDDGVERSAQLLEEWIERRKRVLRHSRLPSGVVRGQTHLFALERGRCRLPSAANCVACQHEAGDPRDIGALGRRAKLASQPLAQKF